VDVGSPKVIPHHFAPVVPGPAEPGEDAPKKKGKKGDAQEEAVTNTAPDANPVKGSEEY
jgi:hypothetical protein